MNYFLSMRNKQDELNERTVIDWKKKDLNFRRAIRLEAAEAMESTPWKWWKKGEADIDNIKIEVIDMLHFALSVDIQDLGDSAISGNAMEHTINASSKMVSISELQDLLDATIKATWDSSTKILFYIFDMFGKLDMSIEEVYKLYMGKNVLNDFRQSNGYKDGTYVKMWDFKGEEVEDNVVMTSISQDIDANEYFAHNLEEKLKNAYREMFDTGMLPTNVSECVQELLKKRESVMFIENDGTKTAYVFSFRTSDGNLEYSVYLDCEDLKDVDGVDEMDETDGGIIELFQVATEPMLFDIISEIVYG